MYKGQLDDKFNEKLGESPLVIGSLFDVYNIEDPKRLPNDKIIKLRRKIYTFYIHDYGDLPERIIDPKYSKMGRIHFPTWHDRNIKKGDLSQLVMDSAQGLFARARHLGYRFKS